MKGRLRFNIYEMETSHVHDDKLDLTDRLKKAIPILFRTRVPSGQNTLATRGLMCNYFRDATKGLPDSQQHLYCASIPICLIFSLIQLIFSAFKLHMSEFK